MKGSPVLELFLILVPIAVVDSLSITPIGLVPLISILAGPRRYSTSGGFLFGLFSSYMIMALAFLFGLSGILQKVNTWMGYRWNNPEPADFLVEIVIGLVLVAFGLPIAAKRQQKSGHKDLPTKVTPASAFGFGFLLNIVGFPGAVPYFAAADQIARANLPVSGAVIAVTIYVVIFILPLTLLVISHRLLGTRLDGFMQGCQRFFETTGSRLMKIGMILLGLVMVADGVAYFFGRPLIPIGFPLG
jgi:cytochrome c biogenesis protein CcdA